jgi:hypothetical protein
MRQTGVTVAAARDRRPRSLVDFGVDETWAPAPSRRRHAVDSMHAADLAPSPTAWNAPPPQERPSLHPPERAAARRSRAADADRGRAAPRHAVSPSAVARSVARDDRSVASARDAAFVEDEFGAVAVSVNVPTHPVQMAASVGSAGPAAAASGIAGRRTVTIRGRGAERELAFPQNGRARRPAVRRHERPGFQPDRTALWALMLGVVLVLVAATSSHAATLSHVRAKPSAGLHATVPAVPAARVLVLGSGR